MFGGGSGGHTWSPRVARGTGWPQLEHFTVGRTWDVRGVCPWAIWAIKTSVEEGKGV